MRYYVVMSHNYCCATLINPHKVPVTIKVMRSSKSCRKLLGNFENQNRNPSRPEETTWVFGIKKF